MIGRFVPWTKPDELPLDEQNPVAALGTLPNGTIECLMGDGQPLSLPQHVSPEILVALATPAGGEVVDAGSLRRGIGVKTTIARRTTGAAAESESGSAEPSRPKLVKPTESANPKQITAKLRRLGLAMHNFLDKKGSVLPVGGDADAFPGEKRPNLSWRVHLLPFLDQKPLYEQFHLNEPWDSPPNLPLLDQMPDIYRSISSETNVTRMQVIYGDKSALRRRLP